MGTAVSEEEKIDSTYGRREPDASRLPGNESLTKIKGAANPENLAGNKDQEEEAENHSDGWELAVVDKRVGTKSKDQQENDHALVSDDAPINCRETDHACASRAG